RRTATRHRERSPRGPHSEYCRSSPSSSTRSICAPGSQQGSGRPSGVTNDRDRTPSDSSCTASTSTSSSVRSSSAVVLSILVFPLVVIGGSCCFCFTLNHAHVQFQGSLFELLAEIWVQRLVCTPATVEVFEQSLEGLVDSHFHRQPGVVHPVLMCMRVVA